MIFLYGFCFLIFLVRGILKEEEFIKSIIFVCLVNWIIFLWVLSKNFKWFIMFLKFMIENFLGL